MGILQTLVPGAGSFSHTLHQTVKRACRAIVASFTLVRRLRRRAAYKTRRSAKFTRDYTYSSRRRRRRRVCTFDARRGQFIQIRIGLRRHARINLSPSAAAAPFSIGSRYLHMRGARTPTR